MESTASDLRRLIDTLAIDCQDLASKQRHTKPLDPVKVRTLVIQLRERVQLPPDLEASFAELQSDLGPTNEVDPCVIESKAGDIASSLGGDWAFALGNMVTREMSLKLHSCIIPEAFKARPFITSCAKYSIVPSDAEKMVRSAFNSTVPIGSSLQPNPYLIITRTAENDYEVSRKN